MPKETHDQRIQRTRKLIAQFKKLYPGARTALEFENPFQLLISTILSAQCTDARVNMVTPGLFSKYPHAKAFAEASPPEIEQEIRSTGFFRSKAKSIIGASKALVEKHGGEVPADMDALTGLPGVGRKTANCVLGGGFGIQSGIVVDTHVQRLAGRLGLSKETTPEKIEADLMELVPKKDWYLFSNLLILHGRAICNARKPDCAKCKVRTFCPSADKM